MEIYLIDGSSYIYRAFYAMRNLSTSKGLPTNAIYILLRMLLKILKEKNPEHIVFVLDSKGPTKRHEVYKEYKAQRQKMPEDLQVQIPYILDLIHALGIPMIQKEGFEADDIIATLARRFAQQAKVCIISGDKDLMQLVKKDVTIWDTLKDKIYDAHAVKEKYGVTPEYIPDLIAIMGDSSDNIPGIPGIGPKGALSLIESFGHLESIIQKAEKIPSEKTRQTIIENADKAKFGFELVRLDKDIEIDLDLEQLHLKQKNLEKLIPLFEELEFKALLQELTGENHDLKNSNKIDYEQKCNPEIKGEAGFYMIPNIGSAVSTESGTFVCLEKDAYLTPLKKKSLCMYDAKDVFVNASSEGFDAFTKPFDLMLAAYCLDAAYSAPRLEDLSRTYLNESIPVIKDLTGSGRNGRNVGEIPKEELCAFLAHHSQILLPLKKILEVEIKRLNVEKIYHEIELPLLEVLTSMEIAGVMVDKDVLAKISKEMTSHIIKLEQKIYEISGEKFNINSTQQLGAILFKKLDLPVVKKTKTGFSTDSQVLELLKSKHELPALVLDYRTLTKLKSTYVDALGPMIDPKTGRIHAKFNQTITATGRISSSDPNMQNIPIRSEEGKRIRTAFVAPAGFKIMSADYSQIELRLLAHITKDNVLTESFVNDMDIHARTASEIFGIGIDEVSADQRRQAKTINFGIIYGMGPHKLSNELGIKMGVAKNYIENYLNKYPGVKKYILDITKQASETGFVTTLMGRRRTIPGINSQNFNEREAAKRIAINTPLQGSAADIIKLAMIKIHEHLKNLKSRMIIQVHDELVFEVADSEIEKVKSIVIKEMEHAFPLSVHLKVDVGIGDNWAEAH